MKMVYFLLLALIILSIPNLALAKDTIIIVPGMMGSYLDGIVDGGLKNIWPGLEIMNPNNNDDHLDELKMNNDGVSINSTVYSPDIIEQFASIFYGNLADQFRNNGYTDNQDLRILHYDWRLDIASSSYDIGSQIASIAFNTYNNSAGANKTTIIAHSMGGLLVKYYISKNLGTTIQPDYINKIIFAGMPQIGSPKAFKLLNYGDDLDIKLGNLSILNALKAKEISQNMPSVYELLPSEAYFERIGPYIIDQRNSANNPLDFNETKNFMLSDSDLSDHRNSNIFDIISPTREYLDDNSTLEGSNKVVNIIGCGNFKNVGEIILKDDGKISINPRNGDGTVPLLSARYNTQSHKNYYVSYIDTSVKHLDLVKDQEVLDVIYDVSQSATPSLPFGISDSVSLCTAPPLIGDVVFSSHSPVDLHVYDDQNRHTGLDVNGDVELGIPDSEFFQFGDDSFVMVSDNQRYRVIIDAYNTGSFDLDMDTYLGEDFVSSAGFNDVPILNSQLMAEFTYDSIASHSNLFVDENGDEVDDYYLDEGGNKTIIEQPEPVTLEGTLDDVNEVYNLGWITKMAKDYILKQLQKAIRLDAKGEDISGILMDLINKLDNYLRQKQITQDGYNLIKNDLTTLLNNL